MKLKVNNVKILTLANHPYVIHKFRYELFEELLKDTNNITISCPYDPILDKLISIGCQFVPLDLDRHALNPLKEVNLLFSCYKVIKYIKPDIILTYTIKPNIYGSLIASLLGIPYICTITGLGTVFNKNGLIAWIAKRMYKVALKHAKCVVFQNQDNLDYMINNNILNGRYIVVNGSGVNTEQFSYIQYPPDDSFINILFIGRLMRDKGIVELFDTAKILYDKGHHNVKIKVIGFCEDDFKKQLESLNLSPNIEMCGYQENVMPYIANAHVVVLPSYHEGMSNSLLEAASCGRPLIASDIPGCREIIDNYQTGILCKPRDVDSLVSALVHFIELPHEEKRQMGIRGRKKVEQSFDRRAVVDIYKKIVYEEKYNDFV